MTAQAGAGGMRVTLEKIVKVHQSKGRRVTAVDGIDLTVEPGELLALLGPSGCGKSSLLDLLAGLESPTSGEIRFDGETVSSPARRISLSPRDRNVAMVFQSYALYPHLTVRENIAFPLRVGGAAPASISEAVRAAAADVDLADLLEAKPSELSGGQRQRVAIARAIVRRPSLFLMDEPLSNLDARLRHATRARIKALQRRLGVTTLYVTHDQQEAMALGDRVAVLKSGRIEQLGTPAELYARPATAFVARFTGNPPMNLLRMRRAVGESGRTRLELPGADWFLDLPEQLEREVPAGATVLLGFRPEHASLSPMDRGNGLQSRIEAGERFGRDSLIRLASGRGSFSVLEREFRGETGEMVRVDIEPGEIRLFRDDGEEV